MKNIGLFSSKVTDWVGTPSSIVVHTVLFILIFFLKFFGVTLDNILLILTTAVSLEAIYLAIFIQMTVNRTTKSLASVEKDIDHLQEDVQEISDDYIDDDTDQDLMIEEIKEIQKKLIKLQQDIGANNKKHGG